MSASIADKILAEQINLVHRHTPLIVGGGLITAGVMVYVLNDWVAEDDLWSWFGGVFIVSIGRFFSLWHHRQIPTTPVLAKSRSKLLTAYSGLSGCQWGLLGYIAIMPEPFVGSIVIVMALTGIVASGIASLSHHLPAFYAFAFPALLPAAYRYLSFGGEMYTTVGFLILLFLFASLFFAHSIRKTLLEMLQPRFENIDLIANLTLEKQCAEAAQNQAEQASVTKSKFLAAASHDLRQPLYALNLFVTTLDERIVDPANKVLVNNIGLSVKALDELFNALLDISKLDAGTLTVTNQHFKLQDLFERLQNDFAVQAREKGLRMNISVTTAVVYSDPLLLARMLRNLLSNALRFTKAGAVTINVVPLDDAVCIKVSDTGTGMYDEDLDRIYEEFVQLHNPQHDRSKGLGLGLSIVKRIALLLDYQLSVESTIFTGSVFSLVVPLGYERQQTCAIVSTLDLEQDFSRIFVLAVDDEPAIREGLSNLLTSWECSLLVVGSAQEAIRALAAYEFPPDVILTDYHLRDQNTGTEVITMIRALYDIEIPALIITGDTTADLLKEANTNGIPVLHKPFETAQLRAYLGGIAKQVKEKEQSALDRL